MKQFVAHNAYALLLLLCLLPLSAQAVYVENMPTVQLQPNGDTLHLFVTGDECYHRHHDAQGYTVVQAPSGWWVYAQAAPDGGLEPSSYPVGTIDPATLDINPGLTITRQQWLERKKAWEIPPQYRIAPPKTSGRNHGDFCNLVIFIRFADDTVYTRSFSSIQHMFSDSSTATTTSVYNYFKHASYNKLFVRTYYAPAPDGNRILSYQSPHPRNYYMPYTEINTIGYSNYSERTEREFDLLVSAVNYINDSAPIPTSYILDCDNDGYIDNVNFVVKGAAAGWNDLLWPHKWNLYNHDVYINGKQVSTFNLALEGSGDNYFGASTFCHEMFHSLGAPDLYRYNTGTNISPVGGWDLMASNSRPPQHMSAYMKYKYGNWIDSIPLITTPGTYTLHSVADSSEENHAYRFPSSDTNQFYVVEYRDNTETFETQLPGKGLLIYRIDKRFNGNAGYNGHDSFDEIWLFRPESNSADEGGNLNEAHFSSTVRRTEFSPSTSYYPYLSDGTPDMTFSISSVSIPGNTISFYYTNHTSPGQLNLTRVTTTTASLTWRGVADAYRIRYRKADTDEEYQYQLVVRSTHATLLNLEPNTRYEWAVRALYTPTGDGNYADSSRLTTAPYFYTVLCNNATTQTVDNNSNEVRAGVPFANNEDYNYTQQIFLASELEGAQNISSIGLHYAHTTDFEKANCTLYLGHTTLSHFSDSATLVPIEQLTPVYTGTMHFTQGWNDFILDSLFYYNGTDNLVVAIDDNSGTPSRVGYKFYTHNANDFLTLMYSGGRNTGPDQDTLIGSRTRTRLRDNIRITGCPGTGDNRFYVCVISDNEEWGRVSGEGFYSRGETANLYAYPKYHYAFVRWNDDNTDNPRQVVLTQDSVFVAYFKSTVGIDPQENQGGFVVMTSRQQITLTGADGLTVNIYDLLGRRVAHADAQHPNRLSFAVPHSGVYLIRVGREKPVKVWVP